MFVFKGLLKMNSGLMTLFDSEGPSGGVDSNASDISLSRTICSIIGAVYVFIIIYFTITLVD